MSAWRLACTEVNGAAADDDAGADGQPEDLCRGDLSGRVGRDAVVALRQELGLLPGVARRVGRLGLALHLLLDVHLVLEGHRRDLFWSGKKRPRHDLKTEIHEPGRHDVRAAVVAVHTHLGDQHFRPATLSFFELEAVRTQRIERAVGRRGRVGADRRGGQGVVLAPDVPQCIRHLAERAPHSRAVDGTRCTSEGGMGGSLLGRGTGSPLRAEAGFKKYGILTRAYWSRNGAIL